MKKDKEVNVKYGPLPYNYKRGEWFGLTVCKSCEEPLSSNQQMYSGGICPHCGKDSNSTIVDYKNIILRTVKRYDYAWWPFAQHTYNEGLRESDNRWLNRNTAPKEEETKPDDDVYASVIKHRIT